MQSADQITPLDWRERDRRELELLPMSDLMPANLNLALRGGRVLVRGTNPSHDANHGDVAAKTAFLLTVRATEKLELGRPARASGDGDSIFPDSPAVRGGRFRTWKRRSIRPIST